MELMLSTWKLETNITFSPDGIRIINMDKSHTILAHLFLDSEKFEYYFCKYPKIVIGVNMFHLFKLNNELIYKVIHNLNPNLSDFDI